MTSDASEATGITSGDDVAEPELGALPEPRSSRRRRGGLAVGVAAGLVALGMAGTFGLATGSDGSAASRTHAATNVAASIATATPTATTTPPADPAASASAGDAAPVVPHPAPPAAPGHLVVSQTYHGLETNDFSGSFELTNDGGSEVEWTWNGSPTIAVSSSGGVLGPGTSVVVEFTVPWQQLKNGAFVFDSSVDTEDQSITVTIAGTRDITVNPGIVLPKPVLKNG